MGASFQQACAGAPREGAAFMLPPAGSVSSHQDRVVSETSRRLSILSLGCRDDGNPPAASQTYRMRRFLTEQNLPSDLHGRSVPSVPVDPISSSHLPPSASLVLPGQGRTASGPSESELGPRALSAPVPSVYQCCHEHVPSVAYGYRSPGSAYAPGVPNQQQYFPGSYAPPELAASHSHCDSSSSHHQGCWHDGVGAWGMLLCKRCGRRCKKHGKKVEKEEAKYMKQCSDRQACHLESLRSCLHERKVLLSTGRAANPLLHWVFDTAIGGWRDEAGSCRVVCKRCHKRCLKFEKGKEKFEMKYRRRCGMLMQKHFSKADKCKKGCSHRPAPAPQGAAATVSAL